MVSHIGCQIFLGLIQFPCSFWKILLEHLFRSKISSFFCNDKGKNINSLHFLGCFFFPPPFLINNLLINKFGFDCIYHLFLILFLWYFLLISTYLFRVNKPYLKEIFDYLILLIGFHFMVDNVCLYLLFHLWWYLLNTTLNLFTCTLF